MNHFHLAGCIRNAPDWVGLKERLRERERERDGQILRGGGLHGRALWIVTTIDNNTRVESARVCRPSTKRRNCGMMTGAGAPCWSSGDSTATARHRRRPFFSLLFFFGTTVSFSFAFFAFSFVFISLLSAERSPASSSSSSSSSSSLSACGTFEVDRFLFYPFFFWVGGLTVWVLWGKIDGHIRTG